ncbi:nitroreductase family deazaflavin-dependent oxidoreductase [Longispora albida]|uniref:nitroreductase family deazaflavin-dependent oxidoreductase n=1 Tax=Longispora albida TaxID=203523 RepID=UPI0003642338|nr:nitroreductase family deazaflavin-dependent oxidoreductase [Longispora albida]
MTEDVVDNTEGWIARHIQRYVDSDGADGHLYQGMPTLLLTTRGRRSGKLRRTPLIYGEHQGRYLIVASNGGDPKHPGWYHNLTEQPEVHLQVGPEKFTAVASTASEAAKQELWPIMTKIFPTYDRYQAVAGRPIPVVILERA